MGRLRSIFDLQPQIETLAIEASRPACLPVGRQGRVDYNGFLLSHRNMEPHGQSPWYLHEIPACAHRRRNLPVRKPRASAGYPPVAESAVAFAQRHTNDLTAESAVIHGQSPWSSAKADKNMHTHTSHTEAWHSSHNQLDSQFSVTSGHATASGTLLN